MIVVAITNYFISVCIFFYNLFISTFRMYFVEKSEKGDDSWDGSEMKEIDHFTHT